MVERKRDENAWVENGKEGTSGKGEKKRKLTLNGTGGRRQLREGKECE